VLWPQAESYLRLMQILVNEGQASFYSEKQNQPYDPERQIFDMSKAKRFRAEYSQDGLMFGFRWLDGSNRLVHMERIQRHLAYHDPALCESKDGDYAAIVVCGADDNGYIYCADAWIEKVSPSRQIEQAFILHEQWKFRKLCVEENNFQGILKHDYMTYRQAKNSDVLISGVKQHQNKQKRIASIEPLITNGHLLFNENISPRLLSQLELFPTDSHDDGPDALHGCVEQLRNRFTTLPLP